MPTSPAPTCRTARVPGFTLIELMVVLALLSIVLFLAVPAFQSLLQGTVERETNRLSGVIRSLRNEAVLTRRPYRLVIDLKEADYYVEERTLNGDYVELTTPAMLTRHQFPSAMHIKDLILNGNTRYPLVDRKVDLDLDVSGFMDPFALRFSVSGQNYTLEVAGFTSEIRLVRGNGDE